MSRVYEALRQSEVDTGRSAYLDPDSIFAKPTIPTPADSDVMAWDQIASFQPVPSPESRLVALTSDNGLGAEKFRLLRARIRNLREKQQVRRIVITSAVPEEGKTLISMNLAVSLAKHTDEKVLLLEGDLRKPMLAHHLRVPNTRGFDDWFSSTEPITKYLQHFDDLQLWLLPAGVPRDNPLTILQSQRFLELYKRLSTCFDWILIDAPPLLPMADVNFWSRHADGLLLVSRLGKTPINVLRKGIEVLDNPRILGVVVNDALDIEHSYYTRYYSHKVHTT